MRIKSNVYINSLLYSGGNILLNAFSFFLIPLYTSYLSTADYGVINLVNGFCGVVSYLIMLSLQQGVRRFYVDYLDDKVKIGKMIGSVIVFVSLFGIFIMTLLFITRKIWVNILFKDTPFFPIVFLAMIISVMIALYTIYQDILKGMQDAKKSVILSYLFFFLILGSNLFTVVHLKMGATGIFISSVCVYAVMLVYMIIDLLKRQLIIFCIDIPFLKKLMKYSLPLVPHSLSYNVSTYANSVILRAKLSLNSLGLYGLASQFGSVSDIVLNSVQSAFQPWFYLKMNSSTKKDETDIRETTYLLIALFGIIYLLIGLFGQEAVILMANKKFHEAWIYIPCLVAAVALKAPLYFYNNFLYYDKNKTKYIAYFTITGCSLCVGLTFLLTPVFGVMGCILADIMAMFVRLFLTIHWSKDVAGKIYSFFKIEFFSTLPLFFLAIGILPVYIESPYSISIKGILYKLLVLLAYALFLLVYYRKTLCDYLKSIKYDKKNSN